MIDAIKHNLANLTNFAGRDSRATFWWYVLFLVVAQYIVSFLATIPLMFDAMGTAFEAAQNGADEAQVQASMMAEMAGTMKTTVWIGVGTTLLSALMLVASFVRRLHDSGNSGLWAIIPMATQAVAIFGSIAMIDEFDRIFAELSDPTMAQQVQADLMLQPTNIAGWVGYLVVIGFGLLKSQEGANRYGDAPQ